jgi:hypothetical protein
MMIKAVLMILLTAGLFTIQIGCCCLPCYESQPCHDPPEPAYCTDEMCPAPPTPVAETADPENEVPLPPPPEA